MNKKKRYLFIGVIMASLFLSGCGTQLYEMTKEEEELSLEFDYSENSRCLGLADLAAAIEQGRPPRASYLQTYHVLEVMTGVMKSAETGMPYEMITHFEREAPMDPLLPHGIL